MTVLDTQPVAAAAMPRSKRRRWTPAQLGAGIPLVLLAVLAGLAPVLPIPGPNDIDGSAVALSPFSGGHLLGTDTLGRDMLSRALFGAQLTFLVALTSVAAGFVVGGALGLIAGYRAGPLGAVIMRIMDVILAFPSLVFAIAINAVLGASVLNVILSIAFFSVPAYARLARSAALSLRGQDYILAARLVGEPWWRIVLRHLLPNALPPLLAFALVNLALAVLIESSLSFLGLGLRPPNPSWGVMIAEGRAQMATYPHLVVVPGLFLFLTLLCINLLADATRTRTKGAS
ncbi:ABC transporter permease subunit [Actinomadura sp. LD22]|uniref:ABC transporter permease subunit n=1 Tax=Actinomadura physcomitrii TaxID=2650748 RepID=A0A6I4MHC0_9ACTN|nr:ABC transporter permease [Actinomadura physcomitrii]MWA01606.1 ABC transporter permease subunit [Actinomadura physcomitrii]